MTVIESINVKTPAWNECVPAVIIESGILADIANALVENYSRREFELAFPKGGFKAYHVKDWVFALYKEKTGEGPGEEAALIVINTAKFDGVEFTLPCLAEEAFEIMKGDDVFVEDGFEWDESIPDEALPHLSQAISTVPRSFKAHLDPMECKAYLFLERQRLQKQMDPGFGVFAHVTSLPRIDGKHLPGTIADAFAFIDWLSEAGVKYWQVLPLTPTDDHRCPYAGDSAFAANLDLAEHDELMERAFAAENEDKYAEFCKSESSWLAPYATFKLLKDIFEGAPWWEWDEEARSYSSDLADMVDGAQDGIEWYCRQQFGFHLLWKELREYAGQRGISIIGDMAIYVSLDSADVWANQSLFRLGKDGLPAFVSGCPPRVAGNPGQMWGHPLYDWKAMEEDGYAWWIERMRRSLEMYDYLRLDHFLGFCRYWAIPAEAAAPEGHYVEGPGAALFEKARDGLGDLPFLAEDLGAVTPAVRALMARCGFPGMAVIHHAWDGDPLGACLAGYVPPKDKVVYTSTHDSDTLVGNAWARYPDRDSRQVATVIENGVAGCPADVCIMPLQDVMLLDGFSRMNTPGTVNEHNWAWRADPGTLEREDLKERLSQLVSLHRARMSWHEDSPFEDVLA